MNLKDIMASKAETKPQASLAEFALYFLKLGLIGFGGPIALVGYVQKELVDGRKWISQEDYLNGLAFSQLAPGPLAAQLARPFFTTQMSQSSPLQAQPNLVVMWQ